MTNAVSLSLTHSVYIYYIYIYRVSEDNIVIIIVGVVVVLYYDFYYPRDSCGGVWELPLIIFRLCLPYAGQDKPRPLIKDDRREGGGVGRKPRRMGRRRRRRRTISFDVTNAAAAAATDNLRTSAVAARNRGVRVCLSTRTSRLFSPAFFRLLFLLIINVNRSTSEKLSSCTFIK